jgi:molybdopterin-binding protein
MVFDIRLFKRAVELEKHVTILNAGLTRVDSIVGRTQVEEMEWKVGKALQAVGMLIA